MKILGVSLGTKNGNNDTMCRVALEAAKEKGAEIEFIHLLDWDIQYCSGCVACSHDENALWKTQRSWKRRS